MAKILSGLLVLILIRLSQEADSPTARTTPDGVADGRSVIPEQDNLQLKDTSPTWTTKQKYPDDHYCKLDKLHFMCTTKGFNSLHLNCKDFNMFSREDVRVELDTVFNGMRNSYALGHWPGDSYPLTIPHMLGLEWDDELADLAERWALQCPSRPIRGQTAKVERFNVTQIVALSTGHTAQTTQDVLAVLLKSKHTFHRKGPSAAPNMLHTAISQYNKAIPMSVLTNPHLRYFGCSVANMMQSEREEGQREMVRERQINPFHRRLLRRIKRMMNRKSRSRADQSGTLKPPQSHAGKATPIKERLNTKYRKLRTAKEPNGSIQLNRRDQLRLGVKTNTSLETSSEPNYLFKAIIVCNFGPVEEPYERNQKVGVPCSACPDNLRCFAGSSYTGLCLEKHVQKEPGLANHTFISTHNRKSISNSKTNETKESCPVVCENGVPHTMCRYNGSAKGFATVMPVSGPTTINYILVWHNVLRDAVASGRHHLKLPLAADMREMTWSKKLEKSAMMWARQCLPKSDVCQDEILPGDMKHTYVNQLVTRKPWNLYRDGFPSFEDDILTDWAKGFRDFTAEDVNFYNPAKRSSLYDNFAQLIWAETYMVGCAMTLCRSSFDYEDDTFPATTTLTTSRTSDRVLKERESLLNISSTQAANASSDEHQRDVNETFIVAVCNYAPGGALEGDSVYRVGGSCTNCQKIKHDLPGLRGMFCSREYHHLCSSQNDLLKGLKLNDIDSEGYKDVIKREKRYNINEATKGFRNEILFQINGTTTAGNVTTISTVTQTPNVTTTTTSTLTSRVTAGSTTTTTTTTMSPTTNPTITSTRVPAYRDAQCSMTHKCFDEHYVHTHCKYTGIAKFCRDHDLIINPLSSTRLLSLHNELRGLVVMGTTDSTSPIYKFPRAGNMRKMIWDSQLETSAKEWAFQCMNGTDECRDRNFAPKDCDPFETVHRGDVPDRCLLRANQLVASAEFDPSNGSATPSPVEFFTKWKEQMKYFDPAKLITMYSPDKAYDDFAQLIWARTFLVGCSYVSYYKYDRNVSKVRIARLVCNYAPAGLLEARSVYKIGGACTLCEKIYVTGGRGLYCSYPLGLCDRDLHYAPGHQTLNRVEMLKVSVGNRKFLCDLWGLQFSLGTNQTTG